MSANGCGEIYREHAPGCWHRIRVGDWEPAVVRRAAVDHAVLLPLARALESGREVGGGVDGTVGGVRPDGAFGDCGDL
jgi:hypothetical protein